MLNQTSRNLTLAIVLIGISPTLVSAQTLVVAGLKSVTSIDIETGKVGKTIPFPYVVGNIAVTPDGKIAYVTGNIDPSVQYLFHINLQTGEIFQINGFKFARGIQITPDGTSAWVADQEENTLSQVDIASNTVKGSVTINEAYDLALVITKSGNKAYVTGYGLYNNTPPVTPVELSTKTLERVIPGFKSILGPIALTPDGSTAYVANYSPINSVTPANTETAELKTPIKLPYQITTMAMSPDGGNLYMSTCKENTVMRVSPATNQLLQPVALQPVSNPKYCAQVVVSSDSKTIYVRRDTKVFPIDVATNVHKPPYTVPTGLAMAISAPPAKAPPPGLTNDVYFIGDSVTAGFGYCGSEVPGHLKNCNINTPFEDKWGAAPWGLNECAPPAIPNDRCSNNNFSNGNPWDQGPWRPGPKAPTISYSYVIAANQTQGNSARVHNWAMTGSEPRHWDATPNPSDPNEGIYAKHIANVKNSFVVMTLGANPLLADYLDVGIKHFLNLKKGICADTTQAVQNGKTIAAPLHDKAGINGDNIPGVGYCFAQQWKKDKQSEHLKNVYQTLIKNGNRVVVMGYPYVCPWSFGIWQPAPNIAYGPSKGNPCSSESLPGSTNYPNTNGKNPPITQEQQAFYLNELANGWIQEIVQQLNSDSIVFVPPSLDWKFHQQPAANAWIYPNDTWVHPSIIGHQQMAKAVVGQMCASFKRWCPGPGGKWIWKNARIKGVGDK